jgi:hypothetical protein
MVVVGSKLIASMQLSARGPAMLECFGGALKFLRQGDLVVVGRLPEARMEGTNVPRFELKGLSLKERENAPIPAVAARYSSTQFTPTSAVENGDPTTQDYLRAFFSPNGLSTLGAEPSEGPKRLPPPPLRARVPSVHAGPLGLGTSTLKVDDDWVFAETDDLATAVLMEGQTYDLGQTIRLVLPPGAEATLRQSQHTIDLEGPMDVRLR